MKSASIAEIKQALHNESQKDLVDLCLRLSKFKKENKELLTYLLFEARDEDHYLSQLKEEVKDQFAGINYSHVYYAKKSLRKVLRIINKYARYTNESTTEISLRIYFCELLQQSPLNIKRDKSLTKMYEGQIQKVKKLLGSLHEDLQYDYQKELNNLSA